MAGQDFVVLAEQRFLVIALAAHADRILRPELPPLIRRIWKDVELERRRDLEPQVDVVERGRLDGAARSGRPVFPQCLDDQPVEIAIAPADLDRVVLVQIELLCLLFDVQAEGRFPVLRNAVGAHLSAHLALLVRLLAAEGRLAAQAEDPAVPRIAPVGRCRRC